MTLTTVVGRSAVSASHRQPVLSIRNLSVDYGYDNNAVHALHDVSLTLHAGEVLGLAGESGCGKSTLAYAATRLLPPPGVVTGGEVLFTSSRDGHGGDLLTMTDAQLRAQRWKDTAIVFQGSMNSLNPVYTIGRQLMDGITAHSPRGFREQARVRALELLEMVGIPKDRLGSYPHQLSGGMRQRVMIAMALSCKPSLLIADEPTTALDVTIQAQILQLIRVLQREMEMAVIFITHDMGVVAEMAERVLVMHRGESVEAGSVGQIFTAPQHLYTQGLLAAVPALGSMRGQPFPEKFPLLDQHSGRIADNVPQDTVPAQSEPILQVSNLVTRFPIRSGLLNRVTRQVHAVENVSFDLWPGETLSLVGESGCGKSTTSRALLQLVESQKGEITFNGQRIHQLKGAALQHLRRDIQLIFQDPYASLDPRLTVGFSIMEPLLVHNICRRQEAEKRVEWLLSRVGLEPEHARRYPHEFSGGQRQRICIARALALNPKVVIADEAVSALDVSIQAQIINLMLELQREFGIAFLFISHDMAVVERISHRVAVMYMGQIVEIGSRQDVFERPRHPYTRKLMSAVPVADPSRRQREQVLLVDEIPSPIRALGDEPITAPLVQVGERHFVANHPIAGAY